MSGRNSRERRMLTLATVWLACFAVLLAKSAPLIED
jgi:hypothetical protein